MKIKIDDGDNYSGFIDLESDYNLNKGDKIIINDKNYFEKIYKVRKKILIINSDGEKEILIKVRLITKK